MKKPPARVRAGGFLWPNPDVNSLYAYATAQGIASHTKANSLYNKGVTRQQIIELPRSGQ